MADSAGLSYFVWDGLNPVAVTDAAGNVKYEYTYGASAVDGVGNLIETRDTSTGNIKVPAFNHRGDVAGTTDASEVVKDTYLYDAFGVEISSTTSGFYNPFQYQSNWLTLKDAPTNFPLLISPSRVYAPGLGRFIQRDPAVGLAGDYFYADNEPTNLARLSQLSGKMSIFDDFLKIFSCNSLFLGEITPILPRHPLSCPPWGIAG